MRSVCWRSLAMSICVEVAVADDLVGRLLRDQAEPRPAPWPAPPRCRGTSAVRFSSDQTWRISSLEKMPWKMLESMMVAGMMGPCRLRCGSGRVRWPRLRRSARDPRSASIAELGEDRARVCSPRRHRVHARGVGPRSVPVSRAAAAPAACPTGESDLAPAGARLQLRVRPDVVHRVDAGIGDLRSLESLDHLRRRQRLEGFDDDLRAAPCARPRAWRCR